MHKIDIEEQAKHQAIELANRLKSIKLKREEEKLILQLQIWNLLQFMQELTWSNLHLKEFVRAKLNPNLSLRNPTKKTSKKKENPFLESEKPLNGDNSGRASIYERTFMHLCTGGTHGPTPTHWQDTWLCTHPTSLCMALRPIAQPFTMQHNYAIFYSTSLGPQGFLGPLFFLKFFLKAFLSMKIQRFLIKER